ncbi:HlyD family secretion protein [Zhouia amylolytica]|uniref:Uncharacterized protein n=1 Tax=Zhouia amylolytica AD3 TaxID=1286632 RepID=W2US23_9FLAO|nr:HlyD family efflux transporter periplasmic adaptor subunit [Zhouia amylolytica]ETN96137.1 hypothetical protein P278_09640 [Zhouia amylolytica AD3]
MSDTIKEEKIQLRSEEVQEILTTPPSWIVRWGITIIFVLTIIILFLSFLIKYPDFVSAKVLVTTKQATEKVVARSTGQLEKLMVNNKEQVKAGQVLAVIENTAHYSDVSYLKSVIDTIRIDLRNFNFPIESMTKLVLGEIEPAYIDFEKHYINFKLLKDLRPYDNDLTGNRASLKEVTTRLNSQIDQRELLEKEVILKEAEVKRYRQLHSKGVISQQEYESKEAEFLQIQKSVNNMTISISQMREAISNANQTLKSTFINKNEDDTKLLKNLLQSYNSLKRAITDWEYKYVLSASIEGNVSFQNFWGVNQYIKSGENIFTILPKNRDDLIGKLTIPSQNSGKVKLDQKVFVKLDNYPYQQYGLLIGKVKNISVSPDENSNYIVFISLPNGVMTSYQKQIEFNQELIGNAEIITEDLSVAERIFFKLKDIFKYDQ